MTLPPAPPLPSSAYPEIGASFDSGASASAALQAATAHFGPGSSKWLKMTGLADPIPDTDARAMAKCTCKGCNFYLKFGSSWTVEENSKLVYDVLAEFYCVVHTHKGKVVEPRAGAQEEEEKKVKGTVKGKRKKDEEEEGEEEVAGRGLSEAGGASATGAKTKTTTTKAKRAIVKHEKRDWNRAEFEAHLVSENINLTERPVVGQVFPDLLTAENMILYHFHQAGFEARLTAGLSQGARLQPLSISCGYVDRHQHQNGVKDDYTDCPAKVQLKPVEPENLKGRWFIHTVKWEHTHDRIQGVKDSTWLPSQEVLPSSTPKPPPGRRAVQSSAPPPAKKLKRAGNATAPAYESVEHFGPATLLQHTPQPPAIPTAPLPLPSASTSFVGGINPAATQQTAEVNFVKPSVTSAAAERQSAFSPALRMVTNHLGGPHKQRQREQAARTGSLPPPPVVRPPADADASLNFLSESACAQSRKTSLPDQAGLRAVLSCGGSSTLLHANSASERQATFAAVQAAVDDYVPKDRQARVADALPVPSKQPKLSSEQSKTQHVKQKLGAAATQVRTPAEFIPTALAKTQQQQPTPSPSPSLAPDWAEQPEVPNPSALNASNDTALDVSTSSMDAPAESALGEIDPADGIMMRMDSAAPGDGSDSAPMEEVSWAELDAVFGLSSNVDPNAPVGWAALFAQTAAASTSTANEPGVTLAEASAVESGEEAQAGINALPGPAETVSLSQISFSSPSPPAPGPVDPPSPSPPVQPSQRPTVSGKSLDFQNKVARIQTQLSDDKPDSSTDSSDNDSDDDDEPSTANTSPQSPVHPPAPALHPAPAWLVRPEALEQLLAEFDPSLVPLGDELWKNGFWDARTLDGLLLHWDESQIADALVQSIGNETTEQQRKLIVDGVIRKRKRMIKKGKARAMDIDGKADADAGEGGQ